MYLFYTDESNLDPAAGEFFVYGGIAVPTDAASQLSEALEKARSQAPLPAQALLKFGPKPTELDWEAFNALKQAYLDSAASVGCVFIVSTLLHKIAPSPDVARRFEINRALYVDEATLTPNAGMERLKGDLDRLFAALAATDWVSVVG